MRTWRGGEIDQFIRPDLTMYPGFSGGPLVNSQGELLGMNTAGLHRSGITVPSATVQRVSAELLEKGGIQRPYLGLAMQAAPLPESLRTRLNLTASEGLLVVHVEPGSPADKAAIFLGDVLIKLDGKPVADIDSVQSILRSHKPGDSLEASVIRGGAITTSNLQLEARARVTDQRAITRGKQPAWLRWKKRLGIQEWKSDAIVRYVCLWSQARPRAVLILPA